jgi:hypothetical protein
MTREPPHTLFDPDCRTEAYSIFVTRAEKAQATAV